MWGTVVWWGGLGLDVGVLEVFSSLNESMSLWFCWCFLGEPSQNPSTASFTFPRKKKPLQKERMQWEPHPSSPLRNNPKEKQHGAILHNISHIWLFSFGNTPQQEAGKRRATNLCCFTQ